MIPKHAWSFSLNVHAVVCALAFIKRMILLDRYTLMQHVRGLLSEKVRFIGKSHRFS